MAKQGNNWINDKWTPGSGEAFTSLNPATQKIIWEGKCATPSEVDSAVEAAYKAWPAWSSLSIKDRSQYLLKFKKHVEERKEELAKLISEETGKPYWEALTEAAACSGKVHNSLNALDSRNPHSTKEVGGAIIATRYKSHGVVSVLGPFNLPAHLPGAHIVPALLAGNTIVFKPSEQTPAIGEFLCDLWHQSGLPEGVLNLVHGMKETGEAMVSHTKVKGVFFTGSLPTGRAINIACAAALNKIVALELGGNNPLVVWDVKDIPAVVYLIIQSTFITAGQRCVCAGRLILPEGEAGDKIVTALVKATKNLAVGAYTESPEPFMGPVISPKAVDSLLKSQDELEAMGGVPLLPASRNEKGPAFINPGIMDVTGIKDLPDIEYFGPFVQVIRVKDFEAAIDEANNTKFGLSAGLISDSNDLWKQFYKHIRAGIVNWNRQITGAVGSAPFGGIGNSGNHRPSASFAADYCAFPVASIENNTLELPDALSPGVTL